MAFKRSPYDEVKPDSKGYKRPKKSEGSNHFPDSNNKHDIDEIHKAPGSKVERCKKKVPANKLKKKMAFKRSPYDEVKPDSKGYKRPKKSEGSNHFPDSNNKHDIDEIHEAPGSKVERCKKKVPANKLKKKMAFKRSPYDEVKPDSKGYKRPKKSEGSNHFPDSNNKHDIDEIHEAPGSKVERCKKKVPANKLKKKMAFKRSPYDEVKPDSKGYKRPKKSEGSNHFPDSNNKHDIDEIHEAPGSKVERCKKKVPANKLKKKMAFKRSPYDEVKPDSKGYKRPKKSEGSNHFPDSNNKHDIDEIHEAPGSKVERCKKKVPANKLKKKMAFKRSPYDEVKPDSKGYKRPKKSEGSNHFPDSNNKHDIDEIHEAPGSKVERCKKKVPANKLKKKVLKKIISKTEDSVAELTNVVPKLLITGLPHSVDKFTLKEVFPLATLVKLSKKASSRYAFLDFSSKKDYSDAVKLLKSLEFCGVKPNYRIIVGSNENVIKSQNTKHLANKPNCLRIRNLPYSLTLNEIKAEFPLADQIHLDINKLGIFNGSCILEMKSNDDLQAVLNECKHKYIGGRLVRAEAQCSMKTQSSKPVNPNASFGLRLKEVPNVIEDSYIKGLFPEDSVAGLSSRPVQDSNTRNVFIFFKRNAQRKSALKMFKNEVIMGYPISCRLWVATNRRHKSQKKGTTTPVISDRVKPKPVKPVRCEQTTSFSVNSTAPDATKKHIVFDPDDD